MANHTLMPTIAGPPPTSASMNSAVPYNLCLLALARYRNGTWLHLLPRQYFLNYVIERCRLHSSALWWLGFTLVMSSRQ